LTESYNVEEDYRFISLKNFYIELFKEAKDKKLDIEFFKNKDEFLYDYFKKIKKNYISLGELIAGIKFGYNRMFIINRIKEDKDLEDRVTSLLAELDNYVLYEKRELDKEREERVQKIREGKEEEVIRKEKERREDRKKEKKK